MNYILAMLIGIGAAMLHIPLLFVLYVFILVWVVSKLSKKKNETDLD